MNQDIQKAIEREVDKKWKEHMDDLKPKLVGSYILTYIAGLGSGIYLQKFLSGPPPKWSCIENQKIIELFTFNVVLLINKS